MNLIPEPTRLDLILIKAELHKAKDRIAELEEALLPLAKLGGELPTGPDWELDDRPILEFQQRSDNARGDAPRPKATG